MKAMIEFLQSKNIKPNKKALRVADDFIKNNGGYQKFNQTYKERISSPKTTTSIQPSRPAPARPTRAPPVHSQIVPPPPPQTNPNNKNTNIQTVSANAPPPPQPPMLDLNPIASPINITKDPSRVVQAPVEKSDKSDLLDSIKNFKGGLKTIDEPHQAQDSNPAEQDIVDQLEDALFKMRKFIGIIFKKFIFLSYGRSRYCKVKRKIK